MKKIKPYQTMVCVLVTCLYACSSEPVDNSQDSIISDSVITDSSVNPATTAAAAAVSTATVYDEDGQAHQVSFDEGTMYCIMASWCPHSRDFLTIVNNKTYDPVTKSYKLSNLSSKPSSLADIVSGVKSSIFKKHAISNKELIINFKNELSKSMLVKLMKIFNHSPEDRPENYEMC